LKELERLERLGAGVSAANLKKPIGVKLATFSWTYFFNAMQWLVYYWIDQEPPLSREQHMGWVAVLSSSSSRHSLFGWYGGMA